ncbi:MAG: 3-dehydroquinate synthase [Akkermansiaceae bacterium]|nr:3-dehydroquinate synthase [Akkermansiaceae bacterium]MDP4781429.1 3-dehydroquinate synthase [Akkermansiaceae bacterium]MDP4848062.1 3-dehydroquinate synthase [Akkermansiaceae bacterium]MDP4899079.1 3-dehydroquinate synthase [Akkermansiaceae bacterium]
MPTVQVDLADRTYSVLVENGLLGQTASILADNGLINHHIAIISDETVASHHTATLLSSFPEEKPSLHTIPAGEASKSLAHAENICREMIRAGHDRRSLIIALGGGVVGDLAGFVASIFYRGIPFVQIPTTIVSQVDSSVGGKTGVNVAEGKNLLGAFHQPKLVIVDPETLSTLPPREFHEGFAEAIKHAAIRDAEMLPDLLAIDPEKRQVPADLLARNIAIKARVVEADEYETKDIRALLNFGHTIGHGIEASLPYGEMLHGEAIALGIRAALYISEKHSNLPPAESEKILALLRHFNLPLTLPDTIPTATVMDRLSRDKKFKSGKIRFVTLSAIGQAQVIETVTPADLEKAIEHLRTERCL